MRQLRGDLSRDLADLEEALLAQLSVVEANIDFADDDIAGLDVDAVRNALEVAEARLEDLVRAQEGGRYLKSGLDVVIVGKPNVGKSSLFNRLLGQDRVIVSEEPGTTRDVVDGLVGIDGVVLKIHDTAGLEDAPGETGREAVRRARAALAEADLALVVLDASADSTREDISILEETSGRPRLVVANKTDLADAASEGSSLDVALAPGEACVQVSALTGRGLVELKDLLADRARQRVGDFEYDLIANERHASHLGAALEGVRRAGESLGRCLSLEFTASDVRQAIDSLGEITGRRVASRVLDEIFSRFCIGK
jgi:tRNA modification GTPase